MRTTIDRAGRLVVPKQLRDALGFRADDEVEITEEDGRLVIEHAPVAKRIEQTPFGPVAVPEQPLPPLTADEVRRVLEQTRR